MDLTWRLVHPCQRIVVEVRLHHTPVLECDAAAHRETYTHDARALDLRSNAVRVHLWPAIDRNVRTGNANGAILDRHFDHRRCVGEKAVRGCDPKTMASGNRASPTSLACDELDHVTKAAGVDRIALGRLPIVRLIRLGTWVEAPRRADQLEQIVLRIALRGSGQLRNETLHSKRVRDIGDRPEPSDT